MGLFQRYIRDESGTTMIEYGLIASLISIVAIAALHTVGTRVSQTFSDVGNNLASS